MKRIIAIALLVPALAYAELTPNKGQFDPRGRVADYNAQNVVKLSTFYGVSTHVQFADGEPQASGAALVVDEIQADEFGFLAMVLREVR